MSVMNNGGEQAFEAELSIVLSDDSCAQLEDDGLSYWLDEAEEAYDNGLDAMPVPSYHSRNGHPLVVWLRDEWFD